MTDHVAKNIITLLSEGKSYEHIAAVTGSSRGKVWRIACTHGARKHEERIQARSAKTRTDTARLALLEARVADMGVTKTMDVLDFLRDLDAASVDCTFSSPPYNVGRAYGGDARSDKMAHLAYLGFMLQIISELARVTKPGGIVALQVGATRMDSGTLKPLDVVLWEYLEMAGLTAQTRIVWPSIHGLTPKKRPADRIETVMVFCKGAEPNTFNPSVARRPQKHPEKRAFRGPRKGQLTGHPLGAFPTNHWDDVPHVGFNRGRVEHPAQFSIELARRVIGLWSMPGDTILDCFSGSGTTQLAAFQMGRAFVGCDLHYSEVRDQRMADAVPDRVSPLPGVNAANSAVWEAEARRVAFDAQLAFGLEEQSA